jgi:tetratricopeptide (TPR) repeat protein
MGLFDRLRKSDEKFSDTMEYRILFSKATDCLQENENEEAIRLFEQILEKEPDNINALNGKGSGLMQMGRLDDAMVMFDESLSIEDNPMGYLNKAVIYGNTGDFDNAVTYCDKVIELYPGMKDMVVGVKNSFLEKRNKTADSDSSQFSSEALELIERADKLKDTDEMWHDDLHSELRPDMPQFRKVTEWDAWELYEQAIRADERCEALASAKISEIKSKLLNEFLFFDISKNDDFNPEREIDHLKLKIMMNIFNEEYMAAMLATNQILTATDEDDLDALNYKGALSFYFDEIDDAIECFEKLAASGNDIYLFYADFNKTFALRRKAMVTGDLEYMVQALDIYDEMLKGREAFAKVKPFQREILDKLQGFMNVPLF